MSIGASRQVGQFFNAIRHHDGCRLVYPAKWDIRQFRGAFVTDVDWCIQPDDSFSISIQFKMSRIDRFSCNSIYHSHSFGFQISHFNSIFSFILSFQRYTQSMYSFHILIHLLISYTHSCTHFIYSFMYSFHIYLVNYQNT